MALTSCAERLAISRCRLAIDERQEKPRHPDATGRELRVVFDYPELLARDRPEPITVPEMLDDLADTTDGTVSFCR